MSMCIPRHVATINVLFHVCTNNCESPPLSPHPRCQLQVQGEYKFFPHLSNIDKFSPVFVKYVFWFHMAYVSIVYPYDVEYLFLTGKTVPDSI